MPTIRVLQRGEASTTMEYLDGSEIVGVADVTSLLTHADMLDQAATLWDVGPLPWEDGGGWVHDGHGTLTIQVAKISKEEADV